MQMQTMFGGGVPQEDMFGKLEQMREVITEVNTQFKNPVSAKRYKIQRDDPLNALDG